MWLLYVTFEDFVCLKHPNKSKELLTTSIDIDAYISLGSSPVRKPQPVTSTPKKKTTRSKRVLCEDFKNQVGFKPIQAKARCPTLVDKEANNNRRYSTSVSYQIAKIQSIVKIETRNKTKNNRQKLELDGSKVVNSMEIGQSDQWNRDRDRMHDLREGRFASVGSTAQGACRSPRCVNATDKAVNSRAIVSGAVTESHGVLLRGSVPRQSQNSSTLGPNNGRVRRYNPQVGMENRCPSHTDRLNQSLDQIHAVGRCVRNPARVETTHSGPRIVNVRALQAITDNALREDPCITNKLSVQSKCWNSLRLQGILPLDNSRFDFDTGLMSDRIMTDPLRVSVRHDISFNSQDGGYLNPRPDSVVPRSKPPQTLSLDRVNMAGRSDKKITSTPDDSAHDVSEDIFHSNESSPVTISSGYESDSLHTCEADIDHIFYKRNKANNARTKAEKMEGDNEPLTDYFSMSDSNLNAEVTAPPNGDITPTSFPQTVLSGMSDNKGKDNSVPKDLKANSKCRKLKQDKVPTPQQGNSAVFSPKERNSYQLTKVARSMFEIIHDLQNEENAAEGKKKGKKPRRNTPPLKPERLIGDNPNIPSSSSSDTTPTNTCTKTGLGQEQFQGKRKAQNQSDNTFSNVNRVPQPKHFDRVVGNPPKVSVRCLRRPLGADPSDFDRHAALPHSDSARASTNENPPTSVGQTSYLEEDTSAAVNDNSTVHWEGSGSDVHPFHPKVPENATDPHVAMINQNWTTNINDCMPYATTRLPGCQTPKRDPEDNHVYETIPGDEMLPYEEHMRLRMNGIPVKLQRLHPDCPFVPYHPPALPARNDNRMPKSSAFMNSSFIMHTQPFVPQNLIQCPRNPRTHSQSFVPQFTSLQANHHGVLLNAPQQQNINQMGVSGTCASSVSINSSKKQPKQRPTSQELPVRPHCYKQKRPVSEQLSQAHKAPAQRRLQLLQKQQLIRQQQQLQLLQQKQELDKQQKILQQKQQQHEKQQHQKQQYLLMRDFNSNVPERASFSVTSTHHHVNKSRSRANSWDGYGSLDLRKINDNMSLSKGASKLSTSDLLDYIDDIKQPPPKRRENFYLLLSNRQNRADFSESLEIESKLKDLGINVNQVKCGEFVDEDGYTTMDGPPLDFCIETGPQFLQSTYV
ncbi:uncharacterized protein LOC110443949 [Mizuhopecten yessoensis]|uniref:Uncharacterized protein n=1 Tax=Mizuhopecten yessoensis TaxID=6573 RepID=A0A210PDR3_MIZYE|nr:uncharacterized protein LOC110443949 [Mizuhopecten yessoensis]OWF34640.1 hypothetical protein KP79_PYT03344 [Mizuhopecten yessoensis]